MYSLVQRVDRAVLDGQPRPLRRGSPGPCLSLASDHSNTEEGLRFFTDLRPRRFASKENHPR